jgi:hypothetical protein
MAGSAVIIKVINTLSAALQRHPRARDFLQEVKSLMMSFYMALAPLARDEGQASANGDSALYIVAWPGQPRGRKAALPVE